MRKLFIVSVFLVAAACGDKDKAGDQEGTIQFGDPGTKLMADYAAIKDQLCACTGKDCTTKLKAEADALEKSARVTLPNPTKEQKSEFRALEAQVNECARKY